MSQVRKACACAKEPDTQEREKKQSLASVHREAEFGEKPKCKRDLLFVEGFYLVVGKEWQICNTIFL